MRIVKSVAATPLDAVAHRADRLARPDQWRRTVARARARTAAAGRPPARSPAPAPRHASPPRAARRSSHRVCVPDRRPLRCAPTATARPTGSRSTSRCRAASAAGVSKTATDRARTIDRNSRSKRSRTDTGLDAIVSALITDWSRDDGPRRRSTPRPCADSRHSRHVQDVAHRGYLSFDLRRRLLPRGVPT